MPYSRLAAPVAMAVAPSAAVVKVTAFEARSLNAGRGLVSLSSGW
jgi:hypothetical protein